MPLPAAAPAVLAVLVAGTVAADPAPPPADSPRIAALQKDVLAGDRDALERFWRELAGKAPLVEPIPGSDEEVWATFVWRGDGGTERVALVGGVPIAVMKELERLPGTDLWYRTERTPRAGRFGYGFIVNPRRGSPAKVRNDPLAARTYAEQSVAEMPGVPPQPWSDRVKGVPEGRREAFQVPSVALKADRKVTVYTPAGYDPEGAENDLLVVFDGEASGGDVGGDNPIPGHVILDNLIAAKKIPPVVAVFVEGGDTRDRDLGCHPPFRGGIRPDVTEARRHPGRGDRADPGGDPRHQADRHRLPAGEGQGHRDRGRHLPRGRVLEPVLGAGGRGGRRLAQLDRGDRRRPQVPGAPPPGRAGAGAGPAAAPGRPAGRPPRPE
ncbi:MAG: DUF3327 domain-containing protein [Gemmataceae bacterium]|nr:DUF3327 domain-containing protein [Gemmataceae bacterium]